MLFNNLPVPVLQQSTDKVRLRPGAVAGCKSSGTRDIIVALPQTLISSFRNGNNMFDSLPSTLLTLFLAFCVLWLIVQAFRRMLSSRRRRRKPSLEAVPESHPSLPEPAAPRAAGSVSTIPDAADVLALKAAIDNLARQVAALEKHLASGPAIPQPTQASPSERIVEPRPELPPVTPDHRI
ncbi:hypothetical protein DC522_31335 [Microvirga sp. KLBC 81]|uniref:hypothetical protein n=1 Tax=Microvirga sp. KLBC 81 TaxID=1862707 RepID=UPI000D50CD30|nr:hypothetical protein [Microvirga sp. KLBC 81]PVE20605.1 hypothetical protein DC522_31335 [Microvirga sp. KLBC 81]